ncbi:MAG: DUF2812 domain-containing protein [Methanomicrobiales archaeon]|jgi:hypothetical protein|nr:DUF2812 domain-containing protein [Methanomicrobiales archaeon]
MKMIIHKLFWAWSFEKEERWLNEMSNKGWQLSDVGVCRYTFEEGLPGEYVYRLEMLNNLPKHPESVHYIRFIEDTGAEHVGSLLRWVYFRKKAGENGFDLFSDIDSRIKHLNGILVLVGFVFGVILLSGIYYMLAWLSHGAQFNIVSGIICLIVGLGIGYGFVHLFLQKRRLEKEKILHE